MMITSPGNTANKCADDAQKATIANSARIRFTSRSKGRTGGNNRRCQYRPAWRFQLEVKANKQRQYNGGRQFYRKANMLISNGENTHRD